MLKIYSLSGGTATPAYTFASAADQLGGGTWLALAVGNDDRLYLVVTNSGVNRIVSFDPHQSTLTDPAITASSLLNTFGTLTVSAGENGKIVVAGQHLGDNELSAIYWPN